LKGVKFGKIVERYENLKMSENLVDLKPLVLRWCSFFFGDKLITLTEFLVLHRVVFDIHHMRNFDEAVAKIYKKYKISGTDLQAKAFLENLFAKMVDRMIAHYYSVEIQEATVVQVKVVEVQVAEARESIVEEEIKEEIPVARSIEFDQQIAPIDFINLFKKQSLRYYLESQMSNPRCMHVAKYRKVLKDLDVKHERYFCHFEKALKLLKLTSNEQLLVRQFLNYVYYDSEHEMLFLSFGNIIGVPMETARVSAFLLHYIRAYCFFSSSHFGNREAFSIITSLNVQYFYTVAYNYLSYGFDQVTMKIVKPMGDFEVEIPYIEYGYHGDERGCISVKIYPYDVKHKCMEVFIYNYFVTCGEWYYILDDVVDHSGNRYDLHYFYKEDSLRKFWPDLSEGFMDGDEFTRLFEFVRDKSISEENRPVFYFVDIDFGNCCESVLYEDPDLSNSVDDPYYLRESSSEGFYESSDDVPPLLDIDGNLL